MTITRRELLAAIGAGSAMAVPLTLKGQRLVSGSLASLLSAEGSRAASGDGTMPLDRTLNATPARSISLRGRWKILKDPENAGRKAGWQSQGPKPGAVDQILPNPLELVYPGYNGVVWYWRSFDSGGLEGFDDVRVRFEGADYFAEAWLNGQYLGGNQSALLPFAFDVKKALKPGKNSLVVRVIDACYAQEIDGYQLGKVPGGRQDDDPMAPGFRHYNYGGLLLPVEVQAFQRPWIADAFIKPNIRESKIAVDLTLIGGGEGQWSASVTPKVGGAAAAQTVVSLAPDGSGNASLSLSLQHPHLWDVWDGFLYELKLAPKGKGTSWRGDFGMREVSIVKGRLAVNGKPILQRSYLYNQIWPVTLGVPYKSFARHDIDLVRKTNANMLRCFSKTPLLATVEAADEAGILLQHESLGSWYLENGPEEDARLGNITQRAVLAYRNHPSLFWWNVLNENAPRFDAHRAYPADKFTLGPYVLQTVLPELHKLDPTRPAIANDPVWHDVDNIWEPGHSKPSLPLIQDHYYQFTGLENNEDSWAKVRERKWGDATEIPDAPYLAVTEWGVNSSPEWALLLQSYRDSGVREDAEDYALYRKLRDMNQRYYDSSGVQKQGFPTFESVQDASRQHVMWRHQEQIALYWGNLHSVGHGLTSFEDSSYELSGVVDNWRNPKPGVYENITRLNRPLQINLWLRPSALYSGDELSFDATLVNERQRLAAGNYSVHLRLVDSSGKTALEKSYQHTTGSEPIEHLVTDSVTAKAPAGEYRLVVDLGDGGRHLQTERPVTIFDRRPEQITASGKVWTWDDNGTLKKWLAARSVNSTEGDTNSIHPGDILLVLNAEQSQLPAIQAAIRKGAHALILRPEKMLLSKKPTMTGGVESYSDLLEPVAGSWKPELREIGWWGAPGAWGYSRAPLALQHDFLEGLPQAKPLEAQPAYQRVAPRFTWLMNGAPLGLRATHAVREANLAVDMPYSSDLMSISVGSGTLVLTSLRIGEHLGQDPAADKIMENILKRFTGRSAS